VNQITNSDLTQFFDDYLYGVKELPLKASFAYVGVECEFVKHLEDLSDFGLSIRTQGEFSHITQVFSNSSAQHAGLYVGDKIVSVNYQRLKDKELIAQINKHIEGDVIKVGILRDELLLEISVAIGKITPSFCQLSLIPENNEKITNQQRQWLYQE